MENILHYLKWRGDITFQERSFHEVDAFICALLSYVEWEDIVNDKAVYLYEACQMYLQLHTEEEMNIRYAYSPMIIDLIHILQIVPRYHEVKLKRYITEFDETQGIQFAAITLELPNHTFYISYRGTDCSILGWKEDFEMTFLEMIPSQQLALNYLKQVYEDIVKEKKIFGIKYATEVTPLYLGGHSKGGNLAMYAAICCDEMKPYINHVYSFDGPGFRETFYLNHDYQSIIQRIYNYVPISSLIGRLMSHKENYIIFNAYDHGLQQHDGFYWKIDCDHFDYVQEFDEESDKTIKYIHDVLLSKTDKEKENFISLIFTILNHIKVNQITDFTELSLKQTFQGIKELALMSSEESQIFIEFLKFAFQQIKTVYLTKK